MATPNPMGSLPSKPPPVSKKTLPINGLHVDIYGLDELPASARAVSCLWLHHGRLRSKADMANIAALALSAWNARGSPTRGLIAVAFDQRNHGARLIHDMTNEAWRQGNKTHAQDMFSMVTGMVVDTSHLMDAIEGYLFGNGYGPGVVSSSSSSSGQQQQQQQQQQPPPREVIDQHLVLGVSLGGHSTWQIMFSDPRVTAGVVVIGCPDYMNIMTDRARLSKLDTYSATDGGRSFLGSRDFPWSLVAACRKYDPKGILFGTGAIASPPSEAEQERLRPLLNSRVAGKKFLVLSGGDDKLVPYARAAPFLDFFKGAAAGWNRQANTTVEDIVYPDTGHEFSPAMMRDAVRFVVGTVAEAERGGGGAGGGSEHVDTAKM